MQPDVVVADPSVQLQSVLDRPPWNTLRAVREHRIAYLPDPAILERPGPRYNDGLAWLIGILNTTCTSPDTVAPRPQRALLVAVDLGDRDAPLAPEFAEFAALARATGVEIVGRDDSETAARRSRDAGRQRQGARDRRAREGTRRRRADGVQRSASAPAHQPGKDRAAADRRSHDADPRYLRAARAVARRTTASRTRPAALSSIQLDRFRHRALAARRRGRHARPR